MQKTRARNGHRRRILPVAAKLPIRAGPVLKPMQQVEFFVPTTLNNGDAVAEAEFQAIQDLVMDYFGGCTLHPHLLGGWVNGTANRCHDGILKIEVAVPDWPDLWITITAIGDYIRECLDQEEVFIAIGAVSVLSVSA